MDPVTVSVKIGRPREEVFAYLADIANHAEFSDHYLEQFRLTRVDSVGRGAGARFKLRTPFQRFDWCDMTFSVVEPPHRIVAVGRGGKFNRIKHHGDLDARPRPRRRHRGRVHDRVRARAARPTASWRPSAASAAGSSARSARR